MHCLRDPPPPSDLSVLERRRARVSCQQELPSAAAAAYSPYVDGEYYCMQQSSLFPLQAAASSFHGFHGGSEKKDSSTLECFVAGWPDLAAGLQYPAPGAANNAEEATSVAVSNSSSRKRRPPDNSPRSKPQQEKGKDHGSNRKRIKEEGGGGGTSEESRQQNNGKEASNSGDTSKENEKPPKTDYIHVRARRGQATDSHSLAERVRRERISQRMKYLQDLVPGCSKITGKAGMLDEIINYVQSLQRQVEFLSMKLAAVNPTMDVNIDDFFGREIDPACKSMGLPSELLDQPPYIPLSSLLSCPVLDMFMDSSSDLVLRQAASTSLAVPGAASGSFGSCLNASGSGNSNVWNANLQSSYGVEFQLGRGTGFPFQSLQGIALPNNLKMEM